MRAKLPAKPIPAILATVLLVAGLASASDARPRAQREVAEPYQLPAVAVMPVHPYGAAVCNQGGIAGGNRGCVTFRTKRGERFVQITAQDATGLPVPGFISQSDGPGGWIPFCGSTPKPLRIKSGVIVEVWVFAYRAVNLDACPGTATTGTVTAVFSKRR